MKKNLNWVTLVCHIWYSFYYCHVFVSPRNRLHFNPLLRALSSSTIPKPNDKSINYKTENFGLGWDLGFGPKLLGGICPTSNLHYCCNIYLIKFVEVNIGRSQCLCRLERDKQNNQDPEIERPIETVVPNLFSVQKYEQINEFLAGFPKKF